MIEDLTMLANLPVCDEEAEDKAQGRDAPVTTAQSEADKTAASETMPPPKEKDEQDPPEQEAAGFTPSARAVR
jgi:hypothetical protein